MIADWVKVKNPASPAMTRAKEVEVGRSQEILIVFGGLPGTGKTTISRELAKRLLATLLRIDVIE